MIRINKTLLLEGFCLLRQAERSLDHVLFDHWHKLVRYYSGSREERVRECLHQFTIAAHDGNTTSFNRSMLEDRLKPLVRFFNRLSWSSRSGKDYCCLMPDETAFITFTLGNLLSLLPEERPADSNIVQTRMDASLCQDLILMRCSTLPQLEKANMIENFDMPEHRQHYAIEDIMQS